MAGSPHLDSTTNLLSPSEIIVWPQRIDADSANRGIARNTTTLSQQNARTIASHHVTSSARGSDDE
jgi:hypothetical protein